MDVVVSGAMETIYQAVLAVQVDEVVVDVLVVEEGQPDEADPVILLVAAVALVEPQGGRVPEAAIHQEDADAWEEFGTLSAKAVFLPRSGGMEAFEALEERQVVVA